MPGRVPPGTEASESSSQAAIASLPASEHSPLLVGAARTQISKAEAYQGIFLFSVWRPFLIIFVCSIVGLAARFASLRYSSSLQRDFYGQYGADLWVMYLFPNQTSGFFLDIGAYDGERLSNSKLLEENGWQGVCADPFPHNFQNRKCKVVAAPIGPVSGVHERMADCSQGLSGFLRHVNGNDMLSGIKRYTQVWEKKVASCPERDMATVGIVDLLSSSKLPAVIDYVSLDTEGSELHILRGWPFERHCVRAWTVEHNCEEPKQSKIKELLESQGCRVRQVEMDWWAMCPCGHLDKGQSLAANAVASASHTAAFEKAFDAKHFFPSKRHWPGRLGVCAHHDHTKLSGE